jgi:hypothetical protein
MNKINTLIFKTLSPIVNWSIDHPKALLSILFFIIGFIVGTLF